MNVKPLFDRVVIKDVESEETTKGGIILTSSAKEKPQYALTKYAGTDVKIDGQELKIVRQSDILAVVE